ncbi:hypothetical protein KP77_18330 [Jeotgalibacillus alimentarius]|uniref:Uncharacterized protein n=1 Tax=Jeotgalibacillus alimentarius TaxID=135826 RepID=A0A0C2W304_9BACL|nr:hypothetical protein KP77_18330 [Jeotgalibacillus alimentarius]
MRNYMCNIFHLSIIFLINTSCLINRFLIIKVVWFKFNGEIILLRMHRLC